MRFTSTAVAFFASIITVSAAGVPDGSYTVTRHSNGTQVFPPVDANAAPIILTPEDLAALRTANRRDMLSSSGLNKLSKRRIDCWGYQLDESGIDAAYQMLANWAGSGRDICSNTPGRQNWHAEISEQMMVYYCVKQSGKCGNADRQDISYAMAQMDSKCRRYEASWFGWPSSFEIVGKGRAGDDVCKGGMDGVPY
ncbi:hypothetical protein ACJQWK_11172 [Exserohilum turcicum]|uniref:Uncharacterized protein n=1 Tax=Exserohilum turcicum (strain 28A) TaxID=671987 RepID=R0KSI1_EXST2|nr:uncharacterized protein SETTUDRAFT_36258 [Exserohilum turcica Et28A]EOA90747.1 hypothetical protein SETTUDRAFT_36258 [Exserohilum turcica Et28A]